MRHYIHGSADIATSHFPFYYTNGFLGVKAAFMQRNKVYEIYNEQAKRYDPQDFWGQVKRSINGKPVEPEQIDMIVSAIRRELELMPADIALDLCCGNGVLTDLVFADCSECVGIDFADYLIAIARKHFERENRRYIAEDVETYVNSTPDAHRFTRILCYGSFQYFSQSTALATLSAIRTRFSNVTRLFLGNLPDRSRLHNFYFADSYEPGIEDDFESPIGLWRSQADLTELAESSGWEASFRFMPESFYAAHYRYDAILTPRP